MNLQHMLAAGFKRNTHLVIRQAEDIDHMQSLQQLPFRGNCFNWVLGHLVENRNTVLGLLEMEALSIAERLQRYVFDSEPISTDGPDIINFDELREFYEIAGERLMIAVQKLRDEQINFVIEDATVGQRLFFYYFHETYHVGQTELLRQLTGKNDRIL